MDEKSIDNKEAQLQMEELLVLSSIYDETELQLDPSPTGLHMVHASTCVGLCIIYIINRLIYIE